MGVGGFKPWMSPLETLRGANQLSCKATGYWQEPTKYMEYKHNNN